MDRSREFLAALGYPSREPYDLPTSPRRFPDGAQYRVEIPSVEGPRCFAAVIEEANRHGILDRIQRVSQGSGIMLLTDAEIREMARMGAESGMEVSLFVGPRGPFDVGAGPLTPTGRSLGWRVEGVDQLVYSLEDIRRACGLGIRSILVADEGLLLLVREGKRRGFLPADLMVKVSVLMGMANPVSIRIAEELGAGTYNVPSDLTLPRLAAVRQAVEMPLDLYVEVPDDFGGFVRHYEIPEFVRLAAPVYIKFGLRNAPNVYPAGSHLEELAVKLTRERVRRAAIGLELLDRYYPEARTSRRGAPGLGVPVVGGASN